MPYALDKNAALHLYKVALESVKSEHLPIELSEVVLKPTDDLVLLVKKSMELAAIGASEEE